MIVFVFNGIPVILATPQVTGKIKELNKLQHEHRKRKSYESLL